jgi:hypothetical protein
VNHHEEVLDKDLIMRLSLLSDVTIGNSEWKVENPRGNIKTA